jgi:hypothetical protein
MNPGIDMTDITSMPDSEWFGSYISENPNVTMSDVLINTDIDWSYEKLSKGPNIEMSDILSRPNDNWSLYPQNKDILVKKILGPGFNSRILKRYRSKLLLSRRYKEWSEYYANTLPLNMDVISVAMSYL